MITALINTVQKPNVDKSTKEWNAAHNEIFAYMKHRNNEDLQSLINTENFKLTSNSLFL